MAATPTWTRALMHAHGELGGFRRSQEETTQGDPLRRPRWLLVVVATVLFGVLSGLGAVQRHDFEATTLLFVVPIALCAIEFGLWGGLTAGLLSVALVFATDISRAAAGLGVIGYVSHAVAFLLLGGLLGRFVTTRRALEQKIARSEELSLDLMATVGFDGYFKRLNRAWERTLGWSTDELRSRPLLDFLHPDDRQRALAELAHITHGGEVINLRNRYRHRDGSYRWLEWNGCADGEQPLIHANARDITVLQQAEAALARHAEDLQRLVSERTGELEQARLETLRRLALAAEYRDDDTHQHTKRVGDTCMLIAQALGLSEDMIETIGGAAPLHDIGKLGVSDNILLKPGKLTAHEYQTMKQHTIIGAAILANSSSGVLRMAEQIALTHHERWDGSGYPAGLAGHAIPLTARITALADAFDAITHHRPYKDAWPIEDALAEIRAASGAHFDPAVVQAFLTLDHSLLVHNIDQPSELQRALCEGGAT